MLFLFSSAAHNSQELDEDKMKPKKKEKDEKKEEPKEEKVEKKEEKKEEIKEKKIEVTEEKVGFLHQIWTRPSYSFYGHTISGTDGFWHQLWNPTGGTRRQ